MHGSFIKGLLTNVFKVRIEFERILLVLKELPIPKFESF
jgi:hypothetical protein